MVIGWGQRVRPIFRRDRELISDPHVKATPSASLKRPIADQGVKKTWNSGRPTDRLQKRPNSPPAPAKAPSAGDTEGDVGLNLIAQLCNVRCWQHTADRCLDVEITPTLAESERRQQDPGCWSVQFRLPCLGPGARP